MATFSNRASANFYMAGPAAEEEESEKKVEAAQAAGGTRVASLAGELLDSPSMRLARQLISLQEASGAFTEPEGGKVSIADQALAVLALAKARSVFGAELDAALMMAWAYLRDNSPAGLGAKPALTNALKGGPYFNQAGIRRELEALSPVLEKLRK